MTVKPWPMEKRSRVTEKIKKECERSAARLGAKGVVIIAFFEEGEYLHMQDAGNSPIELKELYQKLITMHTILEERGGKEGYLS